MAISTGDSKIVYLNNVFITNMTQGLFFNTGSLVGGAYPGLKGWRLELHSSENETVPAKGSWGNGREYQGDR